jgi:hypothetical protein
VLGRTLALCAHPMIAWRSRASSRLMLVAGYGAAGYLATFAALIALS